MVVYQRVKTRIFQPHSQATVADCLFPSGCFRWVLPLVVMVVVLVVDTYLVVLQKLQESTRDYQNQPNLVVQII